MLSGALIFVLAVVLVALVLIFAGVKTVTQGTNWTVERFGRYTRTLAPGLHFIVPFIDTIGRKMNMQENVFDIPAQKVITKDNATVQVDAVAFYQVVDAARAAYEVQNLHQAITNLVLTNIRSVMGNMALDEALSKRNDINNTLLAVIDQATGPWGVKVLRYEIKDLTPPKEILHAMQQQITAEREKRALIAASEGRRQEQINIATGEREAFIQRSEGEKQAVINKAQGEAQSIKAVAEATAQAISAIAAAIRQPGGAEAVQLKVAEKAVDAYSRVAASATTTLVVPSNMTEVSTLIASAMKMVQAQRG